MTPLNLFPGETALVTGSASNIGRAIAMALAREGAAVRCVDIDAARNAAAVEEIAKAASDLETDLIIMATHGRSGVSRWVWGSVADRILRAACVPVLMVRAPGCVPVMTASPEPASKRKAVKPGKK